MSNAFSRRDSEVSYFTQSRENFSGNAETLQMTASSTLNSNTDWSRIDGIRGKITVEAGDFPVSERNDDQQTLTNHTKYQLRCCCIDSGVKLKTSFEKLASKAKTYDEYYIKSGESGINKPPSFPWCMHHFHFVYYQIGFMSKWTKQYNISVFIPEKVDAIIFHILSFNR